MKKYIWLLMMLPWFFLSCNSSTEVKESAIMNNPLVGDFDTPYGVPPFDSIKNEHFLPAYKEGIRKHIEEIDAIVNNPEPATFENTLVALDNSGMLLYTVREILGNLNSHRTCPEIQSIAKEVAPLYARHRDDITMNAGLFKRIKAVYDKKNELNLTTEQNQYLNRIYKDFVRAGANLDADKQAKLRKINEELSVLSLSFGENILNENNRFEMILDNEDDLAGLPDNVIKTAFETGKERGHEGKWVFTLHKPSLLPFLQYSEKRELREKMFKGYINRGDNNDSLDNKKILEKMANLRVERAKLLGYNNHAEYVLENNMAKTPDKVYDLLDKLMEPALKRAKQEVQDMQAIIDREGGGFKLEPWDWWYYAEKVRKEKYDLDEEMLRPYFKNENVRDGIFLLAEKLYGLKFIERTDIPKYFLDAHVYEVQEGDGSFIGILYMDYYPRENKRGGAWMNSYRKQSRRSGQEITPVITLNTNSSKPVGDIPGLLSLDEVQTFFHEFGHALHGLLSDCTFHKLSGTSVSRDFVELPSQIMENWALEPEMLRLYAKHYETGEVIPDELIEKIQNSSYFNQGFATVEYLAASYLDMDWHTLTETDGHDVYEFEDVSMEKIGMIGEIVPRYRSTYFQHIFSGGYSSGYYSYIWAGVLDADAFEAFKESSLFDKETAKAFRDNILSKGGTEDPMVLYVKFRGAEPEIEPLLRRRGLLEE